MCLVIYMSCKETWAARVTFCLLLFCCCYRCCSRRQIHLQVLFQGWGQWKPIFQLLPRLLLWAGGYICSVLIKGSCSCPNYIKSHKNLDLIQICYFILQFSLTILCLQKCWSGAGPKKDWNFIHFCVPCGFPFYIKGTRKRRMIWCIRKLRCLNTKTTAPNTRRHLASLRMLIKMAMMATMFFRCLQQTHCDGICQGLHISVLVMMNVILLRGSQWLNIASFRKS